MTVASLQSPVAGAAPMVNGGWPMANSSFEFQNKFADELAAYLAAANLVGRLHTMQIVKKTTGDAPKLNTLVSFADDGTTVLGFKSVPFEEAIARIRNLTGYTKLAFDGLKQKYRMSAFTIAGTQDVRLIESVRDELTRTLESGGTIDDFRKAVMKLDGADAIGRTHLETVFQTNVQGAYQNGKLEQMSDPAVLAVMDVWQYRTAGDARVRPAHAALDGFQRAARRCGVEKDLSTVRLQLPLHGDPAKPGRSAEERDRAGPGEDADGGGERSGSGIWRLLMATKNIMKFADLSFDQIRMAISDELKNRYGNNDQMYCWVREVFPGYAVYEREGKLWRVDYTVSGTEITVAAESKEVVPEYVPADNAATSMAALADQWLEIFKAGSYGDKGDYSTEDVAQLAETYDAKKDEAPVVIGHPKLNAPAFGWVKEVKADGDLLLAKFGEVNPDFEAAVKAGSFKKRSIALFRGDDGKLRLRHVGYLGAMAPEVKGLADATFSGADFQVVEFNRRKLMDQKKVKKFIESLREVLRPESRREGRAVHRSAGHRKVRQQRSRCKTRSRRSKRTRRRPPRTQRLSASARRRRSRS
jgi:hypothetical protein